MSNGGLPGAPSSWISGVSICSSRALQVDHLERLDEHGRVLAVQPRRRSDVDQRFLERQADRAEVSRVLGLGIDADLAAELVRQALARGRGSGRTSGSAYRPSYMVLRARRSGMPLGGPERLQLGEREVLGEPARRSRLPSRPAWRSGGPRTRAARRRRWCRRSRSRAGRPARRPWCATRSGSRKSAPMRAASSYPARVCSGR